MTEGPVWQEQKEDGEVDEEELGEVTVEIRKDWKSIISWCHELGTGKGDETGVYE